MTISTSTAFNGIILDILCLSDSCLLFHFDTSIEHLGTNEMVWASIDYNLCENYGFKVNNIEELQDKYNKEFDFVITYFNVKSKDFCK
jgi:hypothetical protein